MERLYQYLHMLQTLPRDGTDHCTMWRFQLYHGICSILTPIGQPDNWKSRQDCLRVDMSQFKAWDDAECWIRYPFICKKAGRLIDLHITHSHGPVRLILLKRHDDTWNSGLRLTIFISDATDLKCHLLLTHPSLVLSPEVYRIKQGRWIRCPGVSKIQLVVSMSV